MFPAKEADFQTALPVPAIIRAAYGSYRQSPRTAARRTGRKVRAPQGGIVGGFLLLRFGQFLRVGLNVGFGCGFAPLCVFKPLLEVCQAGIGGILRGKRLPEGGLRTHQFVAVAGGGHGQGGGQ